MKCPDCNQLDTRGIDSRPAEDGNSIRRRRSCDACGKRFTTYETIETAPVMVVKKSGARQQFSSAKLKAGILRACEKRPVPMMQIDRLVEDIERKIQNNLNEEVTSAQIGEYVMEGLKKIDEVAYVRFAAVYREFKDIESWLSEINTILKDKNSDK